VRPFLPLLCEVVARQTLWLRGYVGS